MTRLSSRAGGHCTSVTRCVAEAPHAGNIWLLDAAAYGLDTSADHDLWAQISSHATVWARHGEPVAYSFRGSSGIGPVAGRDPASAAQALQSELAACADQDVQVSIPGSATALVRVAIAAGLHLGDPALLLLFPAELRPPDALASTATG